MTSSFPARLHVLIARDRPSGVILRRGPSRCVCSIGWDLQTDTFTVGQWLRARIYERRSDLSPDGRYLIYFALDGRWSDEMSGSWTAISRAPYLKAVSLFRKGDGWHGGGLFTSERRFWLNDGTGHESVRTSSLVQRDVRFRPDTGFGGECPGVYYPRLIRDGWTHLGTESHPGGSDVEVFEKRLPEGWILRKLAHATIDHPPGKGCYWDEHQLRAGKDGPILSQPDWEWADRAHGRLLWASGGGLYSGVISGNGLERAELIRDFNAMTFERIEAPY